MNSALRPELGQPDTDAAAPNAAARVAYLFTDIDASTERWERAPAEMAKAVARHDEILRAILSLHGGVIRDHAGDGFFAVFDGGSPLQCALEIQLNIQHESWPIVGGLSVRIGIHFALSDPRSGTDQVDVNRAARIAACGWGGQIVISEQALNALALPPRANVEDQGLCRLKGLESPLRLFSVSHPELRRSVFPPLRAILANAQTVPLDRQPLFGREHEVANILSQLNSGERFVTITGPGGQGKTRLAIAAASAASAAMPVYFCPLEPDDDPPHALAALTRALGLSGVAPPLQTVAAYLRDKRALIVLDNADNLAGRCDFVADLLSRCPQLHCLVTSREPLGPDGAIIRLQGLAPPLSAADLADAPAAKLFESAARAHRPSFKLDHEDFTVFRAICTGVGGSPLALHLIGQWTGVLSLEEIRNRLSEGVSFLSELGDPGLRKGLARAVQGSWILLDDHQRQILSKLSAFRPNFEANAASEVAGASPSDLLRLERKSLLERADDDRRFSMHPFVHEFARQQLSGERLIDVKLRHSAHYLRVLRQSFSEARSENQASLLKHIDREFENIAEAWRCALDGGDIEDARASAEALFYFCVMQGRCHDAVRLFECGRTTALAGYCLAILANCYVQVGEYENARNALVDAARFEPLTPLARAHCQQASANLLHANGRPDEARKLYLGAGELRAMQGDALGGFYAAGGAAWLALQIGELGEARRLMQTGARLCLRAGHLGGMISVHHFAGDLARLECRRDDARSSYRQAAEIAEVANLPQLRARLLTRLSEIALEGGQAEESMTILAEALDTAQAVGDQRTTINILLEIGRRRKAERDWDAARANFRLALRLSRDLSVSSLICAALSEWSDCERAAGDMKRAKRIGAAMSHFQLAPLGPALRASPEDIGVTKSDCDGDIDDVLVELLSEDLFGLIRL